eukprot:9297240-Alexandrium_andersonii.AAC.1
MRANRSGNAKHPGPHTQNCFTQTVSAYSCILQFSALSTAFLRFRAFSGVPRHRLEALKSAGKR